VVCYFWTKYTTSLLSIAFNKSPAEKQVSTESKSAGNFLRKSYLFGFEKYLRKY
jgi:hypothetical protein